MTSLFASVLDLGLDEHGEVIERLLPAEITGLDRGRGVSRRFKRKRGGGPVASLPRIDCRVCALPPVQVAKQGDA